jgi:hypothetical protein
MEFATTGLALTTDGISGILEESELGAADLWSVLSVETSGCGYLPDRRPKILFERHIFSRLTGHQYDADDPDVSQPVAGGYGPSGAHQYDRLNAAMQIDREAALKSASWGLGQIMGENFDAAGFAHVDAMVTAMSESEDAQLRAMIAFASTKGLLDTLKSHDWAGFARRYNGPDYAAHNYDGLLQQFYGRYTQGPLPDLSVRTAQIYLMYKGFLLGSVDGVLGAATLRAIKAFQQSVGASQTGAVDDALLNALAK